MGGYLSTALYTDKGCGKTIMMALSTTTEVLYQNTIHIHVFNIHAYVVTFLERVVLFLSE